MGTVALGRQCETALKYLMLQMIESPHIAVVGGKSEHGGSG